MYNPMDLSGKRILVTGASSGIGRACAVELSQLGADLIIVGRNEAQLRATCQMLSGAEHQMVLFDLERLDEIGSLVHLSDARARKIAGIVHSAGVCPLLPLAALTPSILHKTMAVNFDAFVELCRQFVKRTSFAEGGGSLVGISSVSAKIGWPGGGAYCATKAALDGYIHALALELAGKRIRVNTVCPSNIKTPMLDETSGAAGKTDDDRAAAQPLGLGDAEDIAHVVAFLMSDAAKFITGTNLVVDGGYLAQ